MSDISDDKLDELIQLMNKSAGSLGKIAEGLGSGSQTAGRRQESFGKGLHNSEARAKTFKEWNNQTTNASASVKRFASSADGFADVLSSVTKKIPGGAILEEFVEYGFKTADVYKEMTNVGQSFNGSMIQMGREAAQAGLPLKQFADIIKKNSVIVQSVGTKDFMTLQKQVRGLSDASGNYGFTIDQLTDIQSAYLDQQRLQGTLGHKSFVQQSRDIDMMAQTISTFSELTGKSRDDMLASYKAATTDVSFVGRQALNAAQGLTGLNDAQSKFMQQLSSQSGPGTDELLKGMSDTLSTGSAALSDFGQNMIKGAAPFVTDAMQKASDQLAQGMDSTDVYTGMIDNIKNRLNDPAMVQQLIMLRKAGNQQAAEALALGENLKKVTSEQIRQAAEDQKRKSALTSLFTAFDSVFKELMGKFTDSFLGPLQGLDIALKGLQNSNSWKILLDNVAMLGGALGKLLADVFNPTTMGVVATAIGGLVFALDVGTKGFIGFFEGLKDAINKPFQLLGIHAEGFSRVIAGSLAALTGFFLFFKGKQLVTSILDHMFKGRNTETIRANTVNVYGGGGKGSNIGQDLADAFEKKGGKTTGGLKGRIARFVTREGEEVVEGSAGRGLASGGLRGLFSGGLRGFAGSAITRLASGGVRGLAGGALRLGGGLARGGVVGLLGGMVASAAVDSALGMLPQNKTTQTVGNVAHGAITGAGIGATIGSIIPGLGTIAGGAVGAGVGGLLGGLQGHWHVVTDIMSELFTGVGGFMKGVIGFLEPKNLFAGLDVLMAGNPVGMVGLVFEHFDTFKKMVSDVFATFGNWFNGAVNWISNLFSPQANRTPGTPRTPAPPDVSAQMTNLQNNLATTQSGGAGGSSHDLVHAINGVKDAVNQQTTLHGRLLKENNSLQRQGNYQVQKAS